MVRDHVVASKRDAKGDMMIRAHGNHILGTRVYQAEFSISKVTGLPTSVIAESMYAKCDVSRN